MRILFMGTPDFAVPSLKAMVAAGVEVVSVVTQPDRPRGRGMRLAAPPVKKTAIELGLSVLQPEKVREPAFLEIARRLAPEAIVVVAFGQLIPRDLLDLPPLGCINVHPSLLPRYRGAIPIQQALLDGATETGVTTMYLDEGMDTGDIILQTSEPIKPEENAGDLHDRLAHVGAQLLVQTLAQVKAGVAPRIQQNAAEATVTKRIRNEDGQLNWSRESSQLANQVRAFTPWPGAYAFRDGERVKIWRAIAVPNVSAAPNTDPGLISAVDTEGISVLCGIGTLQLLEVQPQNSGRMNAAAYARGRHIFPGDRFS